MPIYEYQCQACGQMLEKLQKFSDAPLVDCPQCQQPKLSKQISLSSFKLKGGGWYETDFKNKPAPEAKSAGSKTASESKSGSTKKAASDAGAGKGE